MGPIWFKRMGDIPGLNYETPAGLDREALAGHDSAPSERRFEYPRPDGGTVSGENLWWEDGSGEEWGGSSRSPAHAVAFSSEGEDQSSDEVLRRLREGLELPGEPSDYHFALQGAAGLLWRRGRDEPELLDKVEELYRLDVELIVACPQAIRNEYSDLRPNDPEYYQANAFHILGQVYEREGFLAEALEVAEVAERYGQGEERVAELRERMQTLREEDAD